MVTVYCDGGSRGNPGPAASAIVVVKEKTQIFSKSKYLGISTNNVAEYTALIMALEYLHVVSSLEESNVVLDSQLVTRQMQGRYKVKDPKLLKLFLTAKKIEKDIKGKVVYIWSEREGNKEADALVNQELDSRT